MRVRTETWCIGIGQASDDLKNEKQVAPEILARYLETDIEQPPFWKSVQISGAAQATGRTVQITLEDGRLVGNMDGRGKRGLIATSRSSSRASTDSVCSSSTAACTRSTFPAIIALPASKAIAAQKDRI
jgi:hypothetical protein